jgi:hypothetical protein
MTRRALQYGCGLCLLLVAVLSLLFWYFCSGRPETVREYETRMATELPTGTPRRTVAAWLEAEGFSVTPGKQSLQGVRADQGHGCLELNGRLTITFYFDDEERLVGRTISKFDYNL